MTAPRAAAPKRIKLALQGGGSHGAFTWGVLDRLLEDPRIEVEAIVGASAGAVNAALLAYGLAIGGADAARERLSAFWTTASMLGQAGPFQPSLLDRLLSHGNMDFSPFWRLADMLSKLFSPYELNPANTNPLRDLLVRHVDFRRLHEAPSGPRLFVCAVNVRTSRMRVFEGADVTADAVMASACLPFLFQAVEIDGEAYWDGGYCGNPPIFPVIYMGGGPDILIIQINPINFQTVPKTAASILDRASTLSFNSSLMREMRAIKFVSDLIDRGELDAARHTRVFIHTIDAEDELADFNVSSKFNPDQEFLRHLFELGRCKAEAFLAAHYDDLGTRSSTDIATKFL
ncbi:MAG TPA: patatin-like phospholipase family protein [Acetobacteraceae bacterium]|nr:patatin-like phospholipase family protein [Acetobacteraceae bacterium]